MRLDRLHNTGFMIGTAHSRVVISSYYLPNFLTAIGQWPAMRLIDNKRKTSTIYFGKLFSSCLSELISFSP